MNKLNSAVSDYRTSRLSPVDRAVIQIEVTIAAYNLELKEKRKRKRTEK